MAAFPSMIGTSFARTMTFQTVVTLAGANVSWRYRKFVRPRLSFNLTFDYLEATDAKTFADFITSNTGPALTFDFFTWRPFTENNIDVAFGDGTTTTFTLPGNSVSNLSMFMAGDTSISYSSIVTGGGSEGEDQVVLATPPGLGVPISASFTGCRRFLVRFKADAVVMPQILTATNNYTWTTILEQAK